MQQWIPLHMRTNHSQSVKVVTSLPRSGPPSTYSSRSSTQRMIMVPRDQFQVRQLPLATQWTGMLDLLEDSLSCNHIEFRRLDGSMPLNVRERAVKEFNTDPEVRFLTFYCFFLYTFDKVIHFRSSGKSDYYVTEGW